MDCRQYRNAFRAKAAEAAHLRYAQGGRTTSRGSRRLVFALAALLVAAAASASRASATPLRLHEGSESYPIASSALLLPDPSGSLSVDQVARRADFRPAATLPALPQTVQPRVYWARLQLQRAGSGAWVLRYFATVTAIDLYVPRADGTFEHYSGGFDRAGFDQAIAAGRLLIPESALDGKTVYLRLAMVGDITHVSVQSVGSALTGAVQTRAFHTFFIGYFIAIALFNAWMFFALRDRALLNYSGVMLSLVLLLVIDAGLLWPILPPMNFLARELLHDVAAYAYFVALGAFTISFLQLPIRSRRMQWCVIGATALNATGLILDPFPNQDAAGLISEAATILYFASLLVAGAVVWRQGMRAARYFVWAISAVSLGYLVNIISERFIQIPYAALLLWLFEGGIALEALLLALAVAERIGETTAQYAHLMAAQRQLEDLALRDGLTGVLNRRAFDLRLQTAWQAATMAHEPLGLLLVDIDHFKRYNDGHGHLAGDFCLRLVAEACAACIRAEDAFARYGGEEFAAIVPRGTESDLRMIGERMRSSVMALALIHADASALTISVGGATLRPSDELSTQTLIQWADGALYRAKEEGRNRTVLMT